MDQTIHRKINVLEMHSSFGYAGGQRNLVTFCKYLNKDIFNVFAAAYWKGGVQENVLKELNIPYTISDGTAEKILNFIKENNINIIHIHRSGEYVALESDIIRGAKSINAGMVIVEKNIFGKFDPTSHEDINCSLFQSMMHLNERFLPSARLSFDFQRMKVFYNMIDKTEFEKFRLADLEKAKYKKEIGIDPSDFVIGKIGRPDVGKWSDLILEMMPHLVKLIPSVKLVVIGVPPSRLKWINKSSWRNNLILLEETSDQAKVHNFYQIIDVLAHSSKIGECNGNTINEAMYWGKPVVVNSTPNKDNGQLEQVVHMNSGIVANHPQTFARAIAYLAANPDKRRQMGESANQQVVSVNNSTVMTKRLEKLFLEKIGQEAYSERGIFLKQYEDISYSPSEEEIINYGKVYLERLKWEFGQLNLAEKFLNIFAIPRKLFYKLVDYKIHKSKFNIN